MKTGSGDPPSAQLAGAKRRPLRRSHFLLRQGRFEHRYEVPSSLVSPHRRSEFSLTESAIYDMPLQFREMRSGHKSDSKADASSSVVLEFSICREGEGQSFPKTDHKRSPLYLV